MQSDRNHRLAFMNSKKTPAKGFTLVEMAIVMAIVGILVGLGSAMIGPMMNLSKSRETKEFLGGAVESVNSWAASNNRLPDTTSGVTSATFFNNVVKTPLDAWGRPFTYLYDANLHVTSKDTICGRKTTSLELSTTDPASNIKNVAYVLISHGEDLTDQRTTLTGTIPGLPAFVSGNAIPQGTLSTATGIILYDNILDPARPPQNDDIVRWVTLDELRSKIGCQGAQLKIVNNELPPGTNLTPYNAQIYADGGVQLTAPDSYSWCVQTTTAGTAPASLTFQKLNASGVPIAITNVINLFQTNCLTYPVASWPLAGQLVLSGNPTPSASHYFTVFVGDNNTNTTSKPFVITINP